MKAIGIVRVSRIGEDEDRAQSPAVQRDRMRELCQREDIELVDMLEELDVSGRKPLAGRRKLTVAIETIEAGRASVLVVAYFDRLVRSVKVQQEIVDRVEAAGGKVLTADLGQVSNGTAIKRLSGTLLGAINEYVAETARERSIEGINEAIAQGKVPGRLIPGLRRTPDGAVELDPDTVDAVREAFQLRAEGKSYREVRLQLDQRGIRRSHYGVCQMLNNEQAVGVLKFGEHRIAVPRLIDDDTFQRARRASAPPGRKGKSERLLARLGVLRCSACDARMVVTRSNHGRYPTYRCPPLGYCSGRVTISAQIVEQEVVEYVKRAVRGLAGLADARSELENAAVAVEQAEKSYKSAVAVLDPTEPAEVERLKEFRRARDDARDAYEQARAGLDATDIAVASDDWDELSLDGRRTLVTRVLEAVVIHPGRGPERIEFKPRKERYGA